MDCFNIVTLASSNSALPDDGDYTETCWSCFNINFNILLKQSFCASVGNKNFNNIKMHGTTVKKISSPHNGQNDTIYDICYEILYDIYDMM